MKNKIPYIFLFLIIASLIYLIKPAILGQINGTFKKIEMPSEYVSLEKYLDKKEYFSRTIWLPKLQRFGFYSNQHPAISAQDFFQTSDISKLLAKLKDEKTKKIFFDLGIEHIIVPYDSHGEIFIKDRKYNNKLYLNTISEIRKIAWIKEVKGFDRVAVFRIESFRDHFWSNSSKMSIKYKYVSPVEYNLELDGVEKQDLIIFSENYNSGWVARVNEKQIKSEKYGIFNSFRLEKAGSYNLKVYYLPQQYVSIGLVISLITFVVTISLIIFGYRFKK